MSDAGNRSFELIHRDDLEHLARLAIEDFNQFFEKNPGHPYEGRLELVCLLQGAAKHFVEPDKMVEADQTWGGVNDFDVCGFFYKVEGRPLSARRRHELDFGPSKFGRNPDESERFRGRRVDIMWRAVESSGSEDAIGAVLRWLENGGPDSSAKCWLERPVVAIWPNDVFGRIIWTAPSVR
jgi:hypothetical protein